MNQSNTPYKTLGKELARIRTRIQESIAEVSGAVEINDDQLVAFEDGTSRPSEDILQLIITHFNLKDEESDKLWELAGYDDNKVPENSHVDTFSQHPAVMLMPLDARIVYSDSFQVSVNQYGVVMNFIQNTGQNNQQVPIARVGMSLEHAKRIVVTLEQTIKTASEVHRQKNLPSQGSDNKKVD